MIGLGILLTAAGGWYFALHYMAAQELRQAEEEADRLDPDWHLADLLKRRIPVPIEENSARVIVSIRGLTGAWPPRPPFVPSRPGEPPPFYEPASTRLSRLPIADRLDYRLASDFREELSAVQPALVEAKKLATLRRGRTELSWANCAFATLLPHVQNTREVANMIQADAVIRAYDGDIDGALESTRAILGVERAIGDEPILISQIVRVAVANIAIETAERVLGQGEASDAALARLQADIRLDRDEPMFLLSIRGERAMVDDVMSKLATGTVAPREAMDSTGSSYSAAEYLARSSSAYVRHNHGLALKKLNRAVEIAKLPIEEQHGEWEKWRKTPAKDEGTVESVLNSLEREIMPFSNSNFPLANTFIRNRAMRDVLDALLACERHRLAHGAWPKSWSEVDPRFLPNIPRDPCSAGPLRFVSTEKGITIYSVGIDGVDDGGRFHQRHWNDQGYDIGGSLRSPGLRRIEPSEQTLPDRVFVREKKADEEP